MTYTGIPDGFAGLVIDGVDVDASKRHDHQTLIVLLSPAAIHVLGLIESGVTNELTLARRLSRRLGVPVEHAEGVLDGLETTGHIRRRRARGALTGSSLGRGVGYLRAQTEAARRHIVALRFAGDHEQADLLERAFDASWDARSDDPARKKRARRYIHSREGKLLQELLRTRTLGTPFALLRLRGRAG